MLLFSNKADLDFGLSQSLCAAPRDLGKKESHRTTDVCQVLGFPPLDVNQQNNQPSVGYT